MKRRNKKSKFDLQVTADPNDSDESESSKGNSNNEQSNDGNESNSLADSEPEQEFEVALKDILTKYPDARLKTYQDFMAEEDFILQNEVIINMHLWTAEQIHNFFDERFRGHTVYSSNGKVYNRNSMKAYLKSAKKTLPGIAIGDKEQSWVIKPEPYNGSMGHPMGTYLLWSVPAIVPAIEEGKNIIGAKYRWYADLFEPSGE
jgi:hypothetical protein